MSVKQLGYCRAVSGKTLGWYPLGERGLTLIRHHKLVALLLKDPHPHSVFPSKQLVFLQMMRSWSSERISCLFKAYIQVKPKSKLKPKSQMWVYFVIVLSTIDNLKIPSERSSSGVGWKVHTVGRHYIILMRYFFHTKWFAFT